MDRRVTFWLSESDHEALALLGERHQRNVSAEIRCAISRHLTRARESLNDEGAADPRPVEAAAAMARGGLDAP